QRPGRCKTGITSNNEFDHVDRLDNGPRSYKRPATEVLLIGFDVVSTVAHESLAVPQSQRYAQGCRDCLGDIFLDREYIGELSVVALTPELQAVVGTNKLSCDSHSVANLANGAFNEMARAQSLTYDTHILVLPFELECRRARDDVQVGDLGKRRVDFFA